MNCHDLAYSYLHNFKEENTFLFTSELTFGRTTVFLWSRILFCMCRKIHGREEIEVYLLTLALKFLDPPQMSASPQILSYSSRKGLLGEASSLSTVNCINPGAEALCNWLAVSSGWWFPFPRNGLSEHTGFGLWAEFFWKQQCHLASSCH